VFLALTGHTAQEEPPSAGGVVGALEAEGEDVTRREAV
jgi:hypothetical protein